MRQSIFILVLIVMQILQACTKKTAEAPVWPVIEQETKPWTRWWWMGNALTKEGITAEMEAYQKAGIGGLEITPIYGVHGYESKFIDYLSPPWMELLLHTLKEGERLNMGIDMATGTGWPFGGPWVDNDQACKNMHYKVYSVKGGTSLTEKIEYIQEPYVRAVGSQVYEVHESFSTERTAPRGSRKEPLMKLDPKSIDIHHLKEPIAANNNLQALALDQVQFEKPLVLQTLMAYSDTGESLDLTKNIDETGRLQWTAPPGQWTVYAVFQGWHGKMVERAGPGGEGNVIDHFSAEALQQYLTRFDSTFKGHNIKSLRAFFNDSYEVDDARGAADWTPALFDEFKKRRGYDLRLHLPALFGKDLPEKNERVLSDYRETIAELVLNNFTLPWKAWSHKHDAVVRNQAHGSPANILDLYAAVDIPEIEGVEPLRMKMASSAAHVTGKRLVSSESATWLDEHFQSDLGDIKIAVDNFLLNGINHIFYHGTCYSPPGEAWPGWLFYAAIHMNPRNPLWQDVGALNTYIARSQSLLQNTKVDQDVLLYFPIYDRFATAGPEMVEHFDGVGKQFDGTAFKRSAEWLLEQGYMFDFISDTQLANLIYTDNAIQTEGGTQYRTLIVPHAKYLPASTWQKLASLAEAGATLIFFDGMPDTYAGYDSQHTNEKIFQQNLSTLQTVAGKTSSRVSIGNDLSKLMSQSGVQRELITDHDLSFLRKTTRENNTLYLLSNEKDTAYSGWLPLRGVSKTVTIRDPMSGAIGKGKTRTGAAGNTEVYLYIMPHQTLFLEMHDININLSSYVFPEPLEESTPIPGPWNITFTTGGPSLPEQVTTDTLSSWTSFGKPYENFSGTATYTTTFDLNESQRQQTWWLDLGTVSKSATVFLNNDSVSTVIGPVYGVLLSPTLLKEHNVLRVRVSNGMSNRIADLDRRHVFWKKFYNVNFPARKAENRVDGLFSAEKWLPEKSGLFGPIRLHRIKDL